MTCSAENEWNLFWRNDDQIYDSINRKTTVENMIYSASHQNVWLRLLSSSSGAAPAEKKPKNHHHKFYQHNLIIVARFVFPLRLSSFIPASRATNASIAVRRAERKSDFAFLSRFSNFIVFARYANRKNPSRSFVA